MRHAIVKLLKNTEKSYYRWKNEERPIIELLEKYFTKEDLEEFLNNKRISKMELVNKLTTDLAYNFYDLYFNKLFASSNDMGSTICRAYFLDFLLFFKEYRVNQSDEIITHEIFFDALKCYDNNIDINKDQSCYSSELEVSGQSYPVGETPEERHLEYMTTLNCYEILLKLLSDITISDINYIMANLNSDFQLFSNDLNYIMNISNKNILDEVSLSGFENPWITLLKKKYYAFDKKEPNIGEFSDLIFEAEYKCSLNKKPLKDIREKLHKYSEEYYKNYLDTSKYRNNHRNKVKNHIKRYFNDK